MKMRRRVIWVATLLATAGAGCGGGGLALRPPAGGGGSGGGSGGADGIADAGQGGSSVAADASRNDSDAASVVAADAGAGGSNGVADASGGGFQTNDGVLCPRPDHALITDFTYVPGAGGTTMEVPFGDGSSLSGTEYVYPISGAWPLTSDMTGNNWHISGDLGDYSGFGLVFTGCTRVDASAFRGISFTISGSVPQGGGLITMGVSTLNDTLASSWVNAHGGNAAMTPGRCIPTVGTNQYNQSSCATAIANIPVAALPTVRTILWSDFTGGRPEPNVTPSDIIAIYWYFPAPTGVGTAAPTPYPVDIVIDDVAFVP